MRDTICRPIPVMKGKLKLVSVGLPLLISRIMVLVSSAFRTYSHPAPLVCFWKVRTMVETIVIAQKGRLVFTRGIQGYNEMNPDI